MSLPSTKLHPQGDKRLVETLTVEANSIRPDELPETISGEARYWAQEELGSKRLVANRQFSLGGQFDYDATFTVTAEKESWIFVGLTRTGRREFELEISIITRPAETEEQEARWDSYNSRNSVAHQRANDLIGYLSDNEIPWYKFWKSPLYTISQ